ncbi:MAG: S49 family peptidase [Anaerolineales bacterium]|nr:S49 family peptidase [Anaerolineales bacterium]
MSAADQKWEKIRFSLIWIVLPLIVGLLIASAVPQPVIGVIRLNDAIYSYTAREMIAQIQYAMDHPEIRAVVLAFDSPGGTVVDTEAVYFELTRLREKKPVVTAINGMAASGAYYLSVNTDYIYAKPTSMVGNIGVIGYLPPAPFLIEDIISTGPYKLWGAPRDSDMRQIEMVKQGFFEVVNLGREGRLNAEPQVIFSGQIWAGSEAVRLGIADEIGTETDAYVKAASLAKVAHYQVKDLYELAGLVSPYGYSFFFQSPDGMVMPYPNEAGTYLLYIPPLPVK